MVYNGKGVAHYFHILLCQQNFGKTMISQASHQKDQKTWEKKTAWKVNTA